MVWPPIEGIRTIVHNDHPGYTIRTYEQGDEASFLRLMADGEFDAWDEAKMQFNIAKVIPGGWFFAIDDLSQNVCGTVMCIHNYTGKASFTGDIGWLACARANRGRGLGYALMAHATNRFISAGYSQIQLHTEYYRLPAIRIYLRIGYLPVIDSSEIYSIWQDVCNQIEWAFTPDKWIGMRPNKSLQVNGQGSGILGKDPHSKN